MGADEVHVVKRLGNPLAWWLVFLSTQFAAFFVVLALDPAGFDPCDPSVGPRPLQRTIGGAVVGGAFALAVWRLRRWHLAAALVATTASGLAWVWLLGPQPTC